MGESRVPAFLCFDVEPDERLVPMSNPPMSWRGFEALAAMVDELRDELSSASGAPASMSWFLRMDPQIEVAYGSADWVATRYGSVLSSFGNAGDELGLHVHCWRPSPDGLGWTNDHADDRWVDECVSTSVRSFADAFGRPARSHRGGDRFFSDAMLRSLVAAGVVVDLTLEPGAPEVHGLVGSETSTGRIPGVPRRWVAPMAGLTGCGAPVLAPLTATSGSGTLVLWHPPRAFRALLDARLAMEPSSHWAFGVRSDVASDAVLWRWFRENLRHLAERLGDDVEWTTPSAAFDAGRLPVVPQPDVDDEIERRALTNLERALHDAELALLRDADDAAAREAALRAERDAVGDDRVRVLETVDGLVAELERLRAEVATYAEERAVLHQERHELATELHRLQAVLSRSDPPPASRR